MKSREMVLMCTPLQSGNRDSDTEIRLMDTAGEKEGGRNGESSTDVHTLPCLTQLARGKLLCNTGGSAQCSVRTQRGGKGGVRGRLKRERTYVYL